VQEETAQFDEMSRIAGVYINRLHKGMKMEADPTVKFAVGDFSIKRVLKRHLDVESPYNTYRHVGLPPGPICLPDPRLLIKYWIMKRMIISICAQKKIFRVFIILPRLPQNMQRMQGDIRTPE